MTGFRVAAQDPEALWTYTGTEDGVPAIDLSQRRLVALRAGDTFPLRLDAGVAHRVRIDERTIQVNGDISWRGQLDDSDFPGLVVLTLGRTTAHATLSTPRGLYQLYATPDGSDRLRGQLRRYARGGVDHSPSQGLVKPVDEGARGGDGPFRITQSTNQPQVLQGGKATIRVEVVNTSGRTQGNTWLDLWFLLETTELVKMPGQCDRETYKGDPFLACRLGRMADGESRRLSMTVRTSAASRPIAYSTALVSSGNDEARDDLSLTVYRDVLHDTDGDGLSDYNEALLGSDPLDPESRAGRATTVIDLLAVKAAGVEARYRGEAKTRLYHLVAVTNAIYATSGVAIQLRLADVMTTGYESAANLEDDLSHLTYASDPALEGVPRQRRRTGADLVVLLRPLAADARTCGLANVAGLGTRGDLSAEFQHRYAAHSVIALDCPDDSVLAHEIGHNMGLVHSRLDDAAGGTFPYSAGHGREGHFSTVMGYPARYHTDRKLLRFSNPRLVCGARDNTPLPCGIGRDDAARGADAVASLNFVRHQVADWYPALEERLLDLGASALAPARRNARILAGVSADKGGSYASEFAAGSRIDVKALFLPDPSDVGELATLHMAVSIEGEPGLWQIRNGALRPMANGLADLAPQWEPRLLPQRLAVDLLEDFDLPAPQPQARRIYLYFGYQLVDSGTLVFSARPLGIRLKPGGGSRRKN